MAGPLPALLLAVAAGCAVPQKPGQGRVTYEREPSTGSGYWLYLPDDYVASNGRRADGERWPLVITLHGLRPYDNAAWQRREWEEEADRYGFIVISPNLRTCDTLIMQIPLRDSSLWYVRRDIEGVMAIMDEVFRRTNADPSRVLVTSFSSGGYLAHYLVNRHPDRFHCLAVRQSNFSEALLDPNQVPRYRNMPIGIFFGEHDVFLCKEESRQAAEWYRRHRFPRVEAKYVGGLGHERTPQTAAAFFASSIGVAPKTPPDLAGLVMYDLDTGQPGRLTPRPVDQRPRPIVPSSPLPGDYAAQRHQPSSSILFDAQASPAQPLPTYREPTRVAPGGPVYHTPTPVRTPPDRPPTPKRPGAQPYSSTDAVPADDEDGAGSVPPPRRPLPVGELPSEARPSRTGEEGRIRLHGEAVGPAPLWVDMSLELPPSLKEGASVLWMNNERPIASSSFSARRLLKEPGDHHIKAIVVTTDDRKIELSRTVHVLPPASRPAD